MFFHFGHQFDRIFLRIEEAQQSPDTGFHVRFGRQGDANTLLRENICTAFNVFIILDFERYVVQSLLISNQLEYVVMIPRCTEIEMV